MSRYFLLASTNWGAEKRTGYPYPYEVSICFERVSKPVLVTEGTGHYCSGGVTGLYDLLRFEADFLRQCNGEWLIPYVIEMINGNDVEAQLISDFRARHNREPTYITLGNV